jgi:hypothetical protein
MRFSKSGLYTHIAYDPHAGVYVFIRCDGTRTALSPYGLDRLFRPSLERPQPPALLPAS